jgi:hypothetical protein
MAERVTETSADDELVHLVPTRFGRVVILDSISSSKETASWSPIAASPSAVTRAQDTPEPVAATYSAVRSRQASARPATTELWATSPASDPPST